MNRTLLAGFFIIFATLTGVFIHWLLFYEPGIRLYGDYEGILVAIQQLNVMIFLLLACLAAVSLLYAYAMYPERVPRPVIVVSGAAIGLAAWFLILLFLRSYLSNLDEFFIVSINIC